MGAQQGCMLMVLPPGDMLTCLDAASLILHACEHCIQPRMLDLLRPCRVETSGRCSWKGRIRL